MTRIVRLFLVAFFAAALPLTAWSAEKLTPIMGEDGIYKWPWFQESFLDLKEDLAEAQGAGKRLVILWEQRGCPYCKETHTTNLAVPEINAYVKNNFVVVQLNMWGDREVTDFDGEVLSEKKLAQKWGVVFTPTAHYIVEQHELKEGKPGNAQVAATMPGYFRPFHFLRMHEYVKERIYDKMHFQRYIAEKVREFQAAGKEIH